jgi:hypothetical protein
MNSDTNAFKELMEQFINPVGGYMTIFETEEDVKKYLANNLFDYHGFEFLDSFLEFNPLQIFDFCYYSHELLKSGIKAEDIVEIFFPAYKSLVGKAILEFADDWYYPTEINDFLGLAKKENIIEVNYRI